MANILALIIVCTTYWIHTAAADDAFDKLKAFSEGSDARISQKDQKLIEFWADAGRVDDDETARCSVAYIRQLQHKIEADLRNTHLTDTIELYYYAELDLLSSCGDKVADLADELSPTLKENENLEMTVVALNKWLHEMGREEEMFPPVAEGMMWTVGAGRCLNRNEFTSAWNQGPCSSVLDKLTEPYMKPLRDFVSMVDDTQIDPMKLISNVSPSVVALVQCCEYFREEGALINAWNALQDSDTYQTMYCYSTLALISSDDESMDGRFSDLNLDSP